MNPIIGMDKVIHAMDFGKCCGAIHYFSPDYLTHTLGGNGLMVNSIISDYISDLTSSIDASIKELYGFMIQNHSLS